MEQKGGIQLIDTFKYSGRRFLDLRKEKATLADLLATDESSVPDGFTAYCAETDEWYKYHSKHRADAVTGKWRKLTHGREVLSDEFVYAITDSEGALLWGIKKDGSCYQPKGIPTEVQDRFDELTARFDCLKTKEGDMLFGVVDALGNELFYIDTQGKAHFAYEIYAGGEIAAQGDISTEGEMRIGDEIHLQGMESDNYLFAICDAHDTVLFGIRMDGEVVFDKGIPTEVRERLADMGDWHLMEDSNYMFAICDAKDTLLLGIRHDGRVIVPGSVEVDGSMSVGGDMEVKGGMKAGGAAEIGGDFKMDGDLRLTKDGMALRQMRDENFAFAICDKEDNMLLGIQHDGRVVYGKGIPDEVQARFDELQGYRIMRSENFMYAVTDAQERLLFGFDWTGALVIPKGEVQVLSWEEYDRLAKPGDGIAGNRGRVRENVLYVINGKGGMIEGCFINGKALTAGEEWAFMRDANVLTYHGRMGALPRIWIDHEQMQLMVDYPSNYRGPRFIVEDGMLFIA